MVLRTVRHLRPKQIVYQIRQRIVKPGLGEYRIEREPEPCRCLPFIPKYPSRAGDTFTFLNRSSAFVSWNDTSKGMLWAYNLNYMDWLLQPGSSPQEGAEWIGRFIAELPQNRIGTDPYPIALRGMNWIKFIHLHRAEIPDSSLRRWNDSLYSQYRLLCEKLEYHLAGNHLLENAFSLFIASIHFSDSRLYEKAVKLLVQELDEQILPDGAHYEQSPMYHCILLDRLLDCCNFSAGNIRFAGQESVASFLRGKAAVMTGHLKGMLYDDASWPLFNDASPGVAPAPQELFAYAERLGVEPAATRLKECGYRSLRGGAMECFADVGNIMASYQAGHSHADTFNYELRIGGAPFVVDTGTSTYDKNARRQYERSTAAHNTVVVAGRDSSEVWGGFRMGARARVRLLEESDNRIAAEHDGYAPVRHRRIFEMHAGKFSVSDFLSGAETGSGFIHLAPEVEILSQSDTRIRTSTAVIAIEGAAEVKIYPQQVAAAYNSLRESQTVEMKFTGCMKYEIIPL